MSRERRLLGAWAFLVFAVAVRALAVGLLPEVRDRSPELRAMRIDINRAGVAELTVLPGIGRTRAEAIVLHRVRRGPFGSVEELAEVDGCGSGTADAVRPFAFAGGR